MGRCQPGMSDCAQTLPTSTPSYLFIYYITEYNGLIPVNELYNWLLMLPQPLRDNRVLLLALFTSICKGSTLAPIRYSIKYMALHWLQFIIQSNIWPLCAIQLTLDASTVQGF